MTNIRIAITGATGAVGGRVAKRLADQGISQRLIVRDPSKAPELHQAEIAVANYLDKPAMVEALKDIETVFFVSGFEAEDRMEQHKSAVDAFVEAGVKKVVYTSFLGAAPEATFTFARQHYHTEEYLEKAGLCFISLRNSMYMDYLAIMATEGIIRGPAGDGKFAPITRDDIADVAVSALLNKQQDTARLDLTGPDLLTMSEVARLLTESFGKPVTFINETIEEAFASRADYDAPAYEVEGWVSNYEAIRVGEMEIVSDVVERMTGHPPVSVKEFLSR
jgi:uncharacterized protein YbjT (DUF2867 family)